jgi:hypothetical protein
MDEDEILEITQGTNDEGLTPEQADILDEKIMTLVELAYDLRVSEYRLIELCNAAWDVCGLARP